MEAGEATDSNWLNIGNVGLVIIEEGEITDKELGQCFAEMWKINWPWQIRQFGEKKFLVRFPPNKKDH